MISKWDILIAGGFVAFIILTVSMTICIIGTIATDGPTITGRIVDIQEMSDNRFRANFTGNQTVLIDRATASKLNAYEENLSIKFYEHLWFYKGYYFASTTSIVKLDSWE